MTLTSVSDSTFLSRLTLLQRRVSEAVWRYQIILQDSVSNRFGSTEVKAILKDRLLDDEGFGESPILTFFCYGTSI